MNLIPLNGFIYERLKTFWGFQMRDAVETCGREAAAAEERENVPENLNGFVPSNGETPQHGLIGYWFVCIQFDRKLEKNAMAMAMAMTLYFLSTEIESGSLHFRSTQHQFFFFFFFLTILLNSIYFLPIHKNIFLNLIRSLIVWVDRPKNNFSHATN